MDLVYGIVSFGGPCGTPNIGTVYTELAGVLDWIVETMSSKARIRIQNFLIRTWNRSKISWPDGAV